MMPEKEVRVARAAITAPVEAMTKPMEAEAGKRA
jgi:hypothetical protein